AAGFVALKTVPGVAEVAAPMLGGPTRRDPSDLLALVALAPTWWWLSPGVGGSPRQAARIACDVGASLLPILGCLGARLATPATACLPRTAVTKLVSRGEAIYARVDEDSGAVRWARSDDNGRTWRATSAPAGESSDPSAPSGTTPLLPEPPGPQTACVGDGT